MSNEADCRTAPATPGLLNITPGGPDAHDDPHQWGAAQTAARPL